MNELGIIINQKGESMSFGKWRLRELRQEDNVNDWHNDSFLQTIYTSEWFQDLGIPYNLNKGFHNQLDMFARCGVIVIVNSSENSNNPGERRIIMISPNTITDEQIAFLLNKKDELIAFENGHFAFIDILYIDDEFAEPKSFYHITDYYDYLDKIMVDRDAQKRMQLSASLSV